MDYKTFKKIDKLEAVTGRMNDLEKDLIDSTEEIQQLKDKLHQTDLALNKQIMIVHDLKQQLHRRNMQIKDLKIDIEYAEKHLLHHSIKGLRDSKNV